MAEGAAEAPGSSQSPGLFYNLGFASGLAPPQQMGRSRPGVHLRRGPLPREHSMPPQHKTLQVQQQPKKREKKLAATGVIEGNLHS
jgi:hypothetical protein